MVTVYTIRRGVRSIFVNNLFVSQLSKGVLVAEAGDGDRNVDGDGLFSDDPRYEWVSVCHMFLIT